MAEEEDKKMEEPNKDEEENVNVTENIDQTEEENLNQKTEEKNISSEDLKPTEEDNAETENVSQTEEENTEIENLTNTEEDNTETENLIQTDEENTETEETNRITERSESITSSATENESKASIDSEISEPKSDTEFSDAQEEIEKSSKHSLKSNLSFGSSIPRLNSKQKLVSTQTELTFPPPSKFKKAHTPIEIDIQTSITCLPTDSDSAILKNLTDETQPHLGQSMRHLEKKETIKSFLPPIDLNDSDQSITDSENKVKILDLCKTPLERKLILTINHLANEMHSLRMFHSQFLPPEQEKSSEIQTKDHTTSSHDTTIKPMYDTDLSASVPKIPSNTFDSQYIKPEYYSFPMYDVDLSSCGEGNNHICNIHCRVLYEKIAEDKPKKPPIAISSEASVYEEAEDTTEIPISSIPVSSNLEELESDIESEMHDEVVDENRLTESETLDVKVSESSTEPVTESEMTQEEPDITGSEVDESAKSNEK